MQHKKPPISYLFMAGVSVLLAIICYAGFIFRDDLNGRLMVGSVWLLMAGVWIVRYYLTKNRLQRKRRYE